MVERAPFVFPLHVYDPREDTVTVELRLREARSAWLPLDDAAKERVRQLLPDRDFASIAKILRIPPEDHEPARWLIALDILSIRAPPWVRKEEQRQIRAAHDAILALHPNTRKNIDLLIGGDVPLLTAFEVFFPAQPRARGRPGDPERDQVVASAASFYRHYRREHRSLTAVLLDDGKRIYKGDFYELAVIMDRAYLRAAGRDPKREPKVDNVLKRLMRKWTHAAKEYGETR